MMAWPPPLNYQSSPVGLRPDTGEEFLLLSCPRVYTHDYNDVASSVFARWATLDKDGAVIRALQLVIFLFFMGDYFQGHLQLFCFKHVTKQL